MIQKTPARLWLEGQGQAYIRSLAATPQIIRDWKIGPGETEVLSWAYAHKGFEVIIDDDDARKCAKSFGIHKRGSASILVLAKKKGLIPLVKPLLDSMINVGSRIGADVYKEILSLAGE